MEKQYLPPKSIFKFFLLDFYFVCNVYICYTQAWDPRKWKDKGGFPGTEVMGGYKPPHRYWDLGPLQEQQVLLASESTLQLQ